MYCNFSTFLNPFSDILNDKERFKKGYQWWTKFQKNLCLIEKCINLHRGLQNNQFLKFEPQKKLALLSIKSWLFNRDPYNGLF